MAESRQSSRAISPDGASVQRRPFTNGMQASEFIIDDLNVSSRNTVMEGDAQPVRITIPMSTHIFIVRREPFVCGISNPPSRLDIRLVVKSPLKSY
jgi:hypothetical protein